MFFFDHIGKYNLNELTFFTVLLRTIVCIICSGMIGIERSRKRRAAGVRTYMLVCLGAALCMMTSQYINAYLNIGTTDPARIGAQVVSGIGFIGAGAIISNGYHQIKGITTAAGLWVSGCLGLAIGAGFAFGALFICITVLVSMVIMDKIETRIIYKSNRINLFIFLKNVEDLKKLVILLKNENLKLLDFETTKEFNENLVGVFIMIKTPKNLDHDDAIEIVSNFKGVKFIEEV